MEKVARASIGATRNKDGGLYSKKTPKYKTFDLFGKKLKQSTGVL